MLSDTHGNVPALTAVFNWAQDSLQSGGIDAAVFLGDGIADLGRASNAAGFCCEWKIIRGNNDFGASALVPETDIFDFGGYRFFLCHGHHHSIYSGYYALIRAACKTKANVVLFGHAHTPFYSWQGLDTPPLWGDYRGFRPPISQGNDNDTPCPRLVDCKDNCRENNILLVNPGSVGRPRCKAGASFAVIECALGKPLKTEFWGIGQYGKIHELKQ